MSSVTKLPTSIDIPDNTTFIERFDHDGVTVTVVEHQVTHRYKAMFDDTRPTPFIATAMKLQDVKKKAMRLIDKLHGNS